MVKCGVLFEVRTEFFNNIQTSFVFKGLMYRFHIEWWRNRPYITTTNQTVQISRPKHLTFPVHIYGANVGCYGENNNIDLQLRFWLKDIFITCNRNIDYLFPIKRLPLATHCFWRHIDNNIKKNKILSAPTLRVKSKNCVSHLYLCNATHKLQLKKYMIPCTTRYKNYIISRACKKDESSL
jgi:hypothetical protein